MDLSGSFDHVEGGNVRWMVRMSLFRIQRVIIMTTRRVCFKQSTARHVRLIYNVAPKKP